jgi:bifunctional non-homologous end joining protein LigD
VISHLDLMHASTADLEPEAWLAREKPIGGWAFQEKIDGIRILAADGRLITRNGNDITHNFPEISAPKGWWLDCEIAVVNAHGVADFEAVNRRAKGGHGGEAVLHAFDVLQGEFGDTRHAPYVERMLTLDLFVRFTLPRWNDGLTLWNKVLGRGGEGIIARRLTGHYVPGRSTSIVKLKARSTVDAIVLGRTEGNGSRAETFGALRLAVIEGDGFREIGECGSGFSARDLVDVMELLVKGDPFVVEVSSLGTTSSGKLRHPSFHRLRPDVDVLSVVGG